jgi:PAS fold
MTDEETLVKGWFQAIHSDERQAMMDGFAKMVRHREDGWTWEARYRMKNGTYQWFLVRVESSREEFGNINYWYGSMMDVDTLLRTKQESENRRKSIMALVSHTDVRLWGFKKDRSLLLQEGSLAWDPIAALSRQSRREDSEGFNATTSDASTSSARVSDTVKDIFDGKVTTYTLEHKDEDRWYRSTLIADLQAHIPHQSSSQATQAVLGLTIDITDVRARAELQFQNEALVEKERAAKEASELKSRFVANVRVLR